MKRFLQFRLILIVIMVVCPAWNTAIYVSINIPEKEKTLMEYCLDIALELNRLDYISVKPEEFAQFIWTVAYCESGHNLNVKGKDGAGSLGLWQMSKETRRKLKVEHGGLSVQASNYLKFLKAGGKRLKKIKSSVDLHCYNFRPSWYQRDVLSKVTNEGLKALDLNKDSVITREDIRLFQKKRLKA